ncbi:hypothetical protein RCL_jg22050.t1 [Rhizophagus clarus]|uniref:Uncharacterized protein n=1 Tax=Rhizophagus clarus TaxID=94130 RepID=A0A8H3LVP4_9GLOM|nr:hypothetical protein RCL_jg22050.t1 [Rhizophagus clarus]
MKKGFLLTKPAKKVKKLDSSSLVTINYDLKSLLFDRFHDIITDFLSDLDTKNSPFFNFIIFSGPSGVEIFLDKYKNQQVPGNMKNLRNPMYQSDMLININEIDKDLKGLLDNKLGTTPLRNNTPLPITFLTKFQKGMLKKKPDNYTLLDNLAKWGKVISVSTRVYKKYLSARVRLIPDYEYLKCYNKEDWTVNLEGIPV